MSDYGHMLEMLKHTVCICHFFKEVFSFPFWAILLQLIKPGVT